MKAVPYLRVSTDDKGQDPKRQLDLIQTWAVREKVDLLPAIADEGTSADKTDPFERPMFLEAISEARDKGADAIVVETVDRLTRRGIEHYHVSMYNLREREKLKLWKADQSLEQQESFAGQLVATVQAAMAQQWMERHKKAVKSGMDRARANGSKFGRKPKQFTAEEMAHIEAALRVPRWIPHANKQGLTKNPAYRGYKTIAHEINKMRGAFDVVDKAAQDEKRVSEMTIRRIHKAMRQISPSDKIGGGPVAG